MNPKYVFTLGENTESVQFTLESIIVNSSSLSARSVRPGDLIAIDFQGVKVYGNVLGMPQSKGKNYWFQAMRINVE